MSPRNKAVAFAPASVGNIGVGFDILGHTIFGPGDRVTVRRIKQPGVHISAIRGVVTDLPYKAERNTAGAALLALQRELALPFGFDIQIDKGLPLGAGMGGSATSCVAALVAANALLGTPLTRAELYPFALEGESVASGERHGDNVGPMLLGGLVLATPERLVRIPVPSALHCALVHPHKVLETRRARAALAGEYALTDFIKQSTHLALVLAGCYGNDPDLIGAGLNDVLIEPRRAPLIRGFEQVKRAALGTGALGCSISGAGASLFAWCADRAAAEKTAQAMRAAFAEAGIGSDLWVSAVNGPAAGLLP